MDASDITAVTALALSIVTAAVHLGRRVGVVTEEVREIRAMVDEIRLDVRKASEGLIKLRTEHELMMRRGGNCATGEVVL